MIEFTGLPTLLMVFKNGKDPIDFFTVDQFSETGFIIVDGVVKEDGGGRKSSKWIFHILQLESNTTEIRITNEGILDLLK